MLLQNTTNSNSPILALQNLDSALFNAELSVANDLAESKIQELLEEKAPASFENTILRLEEARLALTNVVFPFLGLRSFHFSKELIEETKDWFQKVTKTHNSLYQHQGIYNRLAAVDASLLDESQSTIYDMYMKNYKNSGVHLDTDSKTRLSDINLQLNSLVGEYIKNLQDAEANSFLHIADENLLVGLPASLLQEAKQRAENKVQKGYLFSLKNSTYSLISATSKSSDFRRKYCLKRMELGVENQKKELPTKILQLRQEKARILGYQTHAEYKLALSDSGKVDKTLDVLREMREACLKELEIEIDAIANDSDKSKKIKFWDYESDLSKFRRKQNKTAHTFDLIRVKETLFHTIEQIFDLKFEETGHFFPHCSHITTYEVFDGNTKKCLGLISFDFFTRKTKRNGNFINLIRESRQSEKDITLPQVVVCLNFDQSESHKLSSYDVTRVFHETGHALHAILPTFKYSRSCSIYECNQDVSEVPAILMELLSLTPDVLQNILGKELSAIEIEEIQKDGSHSSHQKLIQINQSIFDLEIHSLQDTQKQMNWKELEKQYLWTPIYFNSFDDNLPLKISTFRHLISGGYDAGYYAYVLGKEIASNILNQWQQAGIYNKAYCKKIKSEIYEKGASLNMRELSSWSS